jgi:hypothetical protein
MVCTYILSEILKHFVKGEMDVGEAGCYAGTYVKANCDASYIQS